MADSIARAAITRYLLANAPGRDGAPRRRLRRDGNSCLAKSPGDERENARIMQAAHRLTYAINALFL